MKWRSADLSVRIAVPMVVAFVLGLALLNAYIWRATSSQTVDSSVVSARATAEQFKTLRAYYTAQVVNKVKGASAMKVSFSHDAPDTIPPATMIHELSETLSKGSSGTTLKLYSAYPFPNRAGRKLDAFGEAALASFAKDPDGVFFRSEELGGKSVVRVAVADRMAADACVSCHNSHPDSPKKDWKLKDVRGALEVVVPIDGQLEATTGMMGTIALVSLVAGFAGIALLVWLVRRMVVKPLARSLSALKDGADQVSVASRQQAQGVEQVAQAIAQMEKVTQTTAATAEESAAASEELSAQAETVKEIVRSLEALAGSAARTQAPPAVRRGATKKQAPAPARPQAKVATFAARPVRTAEQEIPFEDTGTYGKF